jgi:uracil-DNA glycosylase family 4
LTEKEGWSSGRRWKTISLNEIRDQVATCRRCPLHRERKNPVPGEGSENARIFLIGEAPGAQEDATRIPFSGRAGRILDGCLSAAGLKRDELFITNVVKCRPPKNRRPTKEEINSCKGYLDAQIDFVSPIVVVTLGRVPLSLFGKFERIETDPFEQDGLLVVPTYHPAAALRGRPGLVNKITSALRTAMIESEKRAKQKRAWDDFR